MCRGHFHINNATITGHWHIQHVKTTSQGIVSPSQCSITLLITAKEPDAPLLVCIMCHYVNASCKLRLIVMHDVGMATTAITMPNHIRLSDTAYEPKDEYILETISKNVNCPPTANHVVQRVCDQVMTSSLSKGQFTLVTPTSAGHGTKLQNAQNLSR